MRARTSELLRVSAALAGLALLPSSVAAQFEARVIPPGKEGIIIDAVQEAFGDTPAAAMAIDGGVIRVETGDGPVLIVMAELRVSVAVQCEGGCSAEARARWDPVAERLARVLEPDVDTIWVSPELTDSSHDTSLGPENSPESVAAPNVPRVVSWLLLVLVVVGFFVAPGGRPPGSRRTVMIALGVIAVFFVAALTVSPPRPLHDHLAYLKRAWCAATLACDTMNHAWGEPTFHVMGLLLQLVPHRLQWILGLGVGLTSMALWLAYDVTGRVAKRMRLTDRAGAAGLWALAVVVLHPGFLRLAGTGSFWPLTLLLLFASFHLALRATEGRGRRQTVAMFAAGAALALALAGNRMVLVLAPLLLLIPWAWKPKGVGLVHVLAAIPPIVIFALGAHDAFGGDHYGARSRFAEDFSPLALMLDVPAGGVLSWRFTTPLIALLACVAIGSRARAKSALPFVYASVALTMATLHTVGRLQWDGPFGYPDVYLKHFPQLLLLAPLFGIGAAVTVAFVEKRSGKIARLVAPLSAVALLATAWTRPDAGRLLFAERVMERETSALQDAFDVLPPHDLLVVARVVPPPEGVEVVGDPLELHFPVGLYRAALDARGLRPAPVAPLERLFENEPPEGSVLLYVGSTLRSFYPDEVAWGQVPETRERPELGRVRETFSLEPAHLFRVSRDQPTNLVNQVAPGPEPDVELGFYWLTPRPDALSGEP